MRARFTRDPLVEAFERLAAQRGTNEVFTR